MAILIIKVVLVMSQIMIQDLEVKCVDASAVGQSSSSTVFVSWNSLAEIDILEYEIYFNDKLVEKIPAKNPGGTSYQSYQIKVSVDNPKGVYQVIGGSSQETIAYPGCDEKRR